MPETVTFTSNPGDATKDVCFLLPYNVPPAPYGKGDVPWAVDTPSVKGSETDSLGIPFDMAAAPHYGYAVCADNNFSFNTLGCRWIVSSRHVIVGVARCFQHLSACVASISPACVCTPLLLPQSTLTERTITNLYRSVPRRRLRPRH